VFNSFPWRGIAVAGALAVIAAGVLVTWRADRMPVMSGRFDLPVRAGRRAAAVGQPGTPAAGSTAGASTAAASTDAGSGAADSHAVGSGAADSDAVGSGAADGGAADGADGTRDSATMWEALSRGEDPTAAAGDGGQSATR
jgi:hypothetical protein